MRRSRLPRAVSAAVLALTLVGCGGGLSEVTGAVSLDGQPIRGGGDTRCTVTFSPASGSGATPSGIADANGEFELGTGAANGVQPGEYLVSISASQLVGKEDTGMARSGRPLTPRAYANPTTSGLKVSVEPGANRFDFALSSDGP
ncbi:hypothetical protein Pla123a_46490 [Posidoniimonas polymericola]|uniref:Carboxypeptidase regulatory-like domain-containing protein n=1 Tax=Posidoniimonas polymericola TaxID=2528002 RepID=A0A5C5XW55_9BACT|nr:hypothetical protein [Posidoniimonas polymericola]TWT66761.1 hypothetical protein Pla123a_46490 [Posidoniimonas polymericola]